MTQQDKIPLAQTNISGKNFTGSWGGVQNNSNFASYVSS